MNFSQVKGNREVVRTLVSMVDSGRIPHAVMFHEEDGGEAFPLCLALLSYLYCRNRAHSDSCSQCPSCNRIDKLIHPDVHFIFPTASSALTGQYMAQLRGLVSEKLPFTEDDVCSAFGIEGKRQIIAVGEARHLLDSLSVTALEGGYRSVVIYLPEKMNAEAANRLLKIVEEPPQLTLFLMITHHPEQVLQTISSRCLHIQVERREPTGRPWPSSLPNSSTDLWTRSARATCSRATRRPTDFLRFPRARMPKLFVNLQHIGCAISSLPSKDCPFLRMRARRLPAGLRSAGKASRATRSGCSTGPRGCSTST